MRYIFILCVALSGCASMTENQCRVANWYDQGEREALMGNRPWIEQYAYQCPKYNITPDAKEYMAGWNIGYSEYNRRLSGSTDAPH